MKPYTRPIKPPRDLVATINETWRDAYPDASPTDDPEALALRVHQLGVDRRCWMDNARANEKEMQRLAAKLSETK